MMIYSVNWNDITSTQKWDDFTSWLITNLGEPGPRWHTAEVTGENMVLMVRHPQDVDLLILRWGGRAWSWTSEEW